ncbi:MAG: hypothetical protein ACR2MZ_06550 [Candidatus Dormibacter sp.]|uniref:hypothetical protein n=1 Tax=Candidatus Dormibacter sp. TaxID=2973982 RepID=UPI0026CF203F
MSRARTRPAARLLAWASVAGLAVGVVLELLTVLLAIAGPEDPDGRCGETVP